jgi:hypothetical protein
MATGISRADRPWLTVGIIGVSLGIAVGAIVGVLAGSLAGRHEIPVHATATHGQDNYAMATGKLEEDVELVVFLDALTADLKAAAINVRNYKFQAFYSRNIKNDFKGLPDKNPRFLMVTGHSAYQTHAGARYGQSTIYITELNSGQCNAYAVQSFTNRKSANQKIQGNFLPLDRVDFRQAQVRPGTTTSTGK